MTRQLSAWEELYDQYAPRLYGLILQRVPPATSAWVLERTFLEMYRHIQDYIPDNERFYTWMSRITLANCAYTNEVFKDPSGWPLTTDRDRKQSNGLN